MPSCPQSKPVPLGQDRSGQLGRHAPPGDANPVTAAVGTDQFLSRLTKVQILQHLGQSRALCEAQWVEAGTILATALRDKARCVSRIL